jgi:hypothetical protein
MMKSTAALVALLSASASAFAPAQQSARSSAVSLNAERSKSLPFMNRPPLVSIVMDCENECSSDDEKQCKNRAWRWTGKRRNDEAKTVRCFLILLSLT